MSHSVLLTSVGILLAIATAAWTTVRLGSWRALAIGTIGAVATSTLGAWLYTKRAIPHPPPCALPTKPAELGSICGFNNPEDLHYVSSQGVIVVSEEGFGGRVLALSTEDLTMRPRILWPPENEALHRMAERTGDLGDRDCPFPAKPAALWPHGLSVLENPGAASVRVAFVSHRMEGDSLADAIQFFDLHADRSKPFEWRGCLNLPDDVIGNDIALLRDGSLLATNFAPRGTPSELQRTVMRGGLGFDTGDILRWTSKDGWTHLPGTRGALPNGIVVSMDERTLFYADAGNSEVVVMPLWRNGKAARVKVGGAPNNLTLTRSGTVLATGATLSGDLPILCSLSGRECRVGWAVWEIDPNTATATEIAAEEGRYLSNATTALEVDSVLYIGSMADTRLGIYRRR